MDPPGFVCETIVISRPVVHPSESDKEVEGTVVNLYNSGSLPKMWVLLVNSGNYRDFWKSR